jgi:hypothetical protein
VTAGGYVDDVLDDDVLDDDDATEDSVVPSASSSLATSLGYQLGAVTVRGRAVPALVWRDELDALPEPSETVQDTRTGPTVDVPACLRPLPGEPALEVWHGTHRLPGAAVRVALARETRETSSPAFWRARLPGVVIEAARCDRWSPDGCGMRRVWRLEATDDGPSPDAAGPDEVQPIAGTIAVRFGRLLAVRAVRSAVPLPGYPDLVVYDVPAASLADLVRQLEAGAHLR